LALFPRARALTLSHRTQRLRLAWILVPPFLYFATPTRGSLLSSLFLVIPGLLLRASAAGYIEKDRVLARVGPYAYLRHPLYVGSFLIGLGLATAGGRWLFLPLFLLCFVFLYGRTIRIEEGELAGTFGESYGQYRKQVPAFFPRIPTGGGGPPQIPRETSDAHFSPGLFVRNREWEATLGVAGGLALLLGKLLWLG